MLALILSAACLVQFTVQPGFVVTRAEPAAVFTVKSAEVPKAAPAPAPAPSRSWLDVRTTNGTRRVWGWAEGGQIKWYESEQPRQQAPAPRVFYYAAPATCVGGSCYRTR